jgi:phospholipid/cholesterol/gamma-HCH transport system substrate-binding protein
MAKHAGFKWKVGLFVTAGLLILIGTIYFIGKQKNLFGDTIRLKAVFETVGGLKTGNNVRLSGINVGTVDNIELITDSSVLVEMLIEKDVQRFIKSDAIARIGADGLMGDKNIVIVPGGNSRVMVKHNAYLKAKVPLDVDSITMSLRNTLANTEIITKQISEIVYKVNHGDGALSRLISDDALASDLTTTMENLKQSSSGLQENMDAAKDNILLRGHFKKKEKAEKKAGEKVIKDAKDQEKKDEKDVKDSKKKTDKEEKVQEKKEKKEAEELEKQKKKDQKKIEE